jgi:carboxypeptidase Taq
MEYEKLRAIDRECLRLERTAALLQWDQETYLPPGGVEERAEQLAAREGLAHERLSSTETGRLFDEAGSAKSQGAAIERDFLRVMRRKYDRAVKLPPAFVREAARAEGLSQAAWAQARKNNDFAAFLPHLKTMIGIARKKPEYWRQTGNGSKSRYDCLLDIYEPGMGEEEIASLFAVLKDRLVPLLGKILACPPPDVSFLKQPFPVEGQAAFCQKLLGYLGFDCNRGRMDTSAHPFTTTLGSNDVRITTRYFQDNVLSGLFSVIHETGHALYEMGFPPELRMSCLGDGASMAVHESQSRLWENVIGRGLPFWEGLFPLLRDSFPSQLAGIGAEQFYRAVNEVKRPLIRVDADEVSYCLHIIFRFELEQQLISGELDPERLPAAWNGKMTECLGLPAGSVPNDADGVLQDIHWSMGSFGYFPSYLLGNLYGLQFFTKMSGDIPGLPGLIAEGKFGRLHEWLRDNVYRWGCRLEPSELLQTVTGEKLQAEPFLGYIEEKYVRLYH